MVAKNAKMSKLHKQMDSAQLACHMISLCSVLMKPHLESCIHFLGPQFMEDINNLGHPQQGVSKMGMVNQVLLETVKEGGMFHPGKTIKR